MGRNNNDNGNDNKISGFGKLVFVLSILSVIASVAFVWAGYAFFTSEFPDVTVLKTQYPLVRYIGKKEPPVVVLQKSRPASWVSLSEVSRVAVGAIIVSEDWAFYQHQGYDANQIKEAIKEDIEEGKFARGASTITQQVVKNVFLERDKNLWRKVKELYLAVRLEQTVGKRKILETYLNVAEWGEGIFGINAASRHYFSKHPSQLTAKEGAFLAMLLPSPKRYSQSFRRKELTSYAKSTIRSILGKMAQARYLTEEEKEVEASAPLPFEAPPESPELKELPPAEDERELPESSEA
jgi:monofunctional glycosyltransferase